MIETIIKKAIEGGWNLEQRLNALGVFKGIDAMVLDPLFWQALGKACGWIVEEESTYHRVNDFPVNKNEWIYKALRFHEINLTEGWDKAVEYLSDIIK